MSTIKISIPEEEIKEESAENISVDKIQVDESIVKITTDENTPAINQPILTINKTPYIRMNVAVGILAAIALVAALYLAHAFFVPLLIGILASYTLSPTH